MEKIKVIIKRPDEMIGHIEEIDYTLKTFQEIVGGYIETVPVLHDVTMIVNEEGKIKRMPRNIILGQDFVDMIVGTLILVGVDDESEEFTDCPMNLKTWEQLLRAWGNL